MDAPSVTLEGSDETNQTRTLGMESRGVIRERETDTMKLGGSLDVAVLAVG